MTSFFFSPLSRGVSRLGRAPQLTLFAMSCLAFVAGWMAGTSGEAAAALTQMGPELALVLRFMAGVKALFALALVLVAAWRLGHPVTLTAAWFYIGASALMSGAPGLIWTLNHVAAGALAFHAGLLLFLGTAWRDRLKPTTRAITWLTRPHASSARAGRSPLRPAN